MSGLDPEDWDEFRRSAHRALDEMVSYLQTVGERDVWRPVQEASRQFIERPMASPPRRLDAVISDVMQHVAPYATGNLHPRFMGWFHGAGTPVGMVAEMMSAGLNMNCGGRNHVGLVMEHQITRWLSGLAGYPDGAAGLFVTGSSIANFLAIYIAAIAAAGPEARREGLARSPHRLMAYASVRAHGCIARAMEMAGLGHGSLRRIPVDAAGRMDIAALEAAISRDRQEEFQPFIAIGTAGTVDTGAIDPLDEIAEISRREGLWFHVDGAIGALGLLSQRLRPLLRGIEGSSSVALDFHKWGHVPYDAGFLLMRDQAAQLAAFSNGQNYLQRGERGLSAGDVWPCDLGPDLSRSFKALKTWMTFEALGAEAIAASIDRACALAAYMAERVEEHSGLVLKAPVALNIVCFGVKGVENASGCNREIVMRLQESGVAVPSWTVLNGETVIRCAIVNHRTTRTDVDRVLASIGEQAKSLAAERNSIRTF